MLIGAGSLLSNIPASMLTMARGERWALVAASLGCAAAMALCAWTRQLWLFALGCFLVGAAQAVFSLARQSYLTDAAPPHYRARAMSMLGGVMRIGLFIGPFAGAAAIHRFGLAGAYAVGIAVLLISGLLAARLPELQVHDAAAPTPAGLPESTWLSTLRDHRRVFVALGVGVLLVSAVRASRQAVIPLWADHLALQASVTSLIYGLAAGLEMLVFYPAGKLMDRKGRRWVAVPSMLIMGVALLLTPLSTGAASLLLAAAAIGFGNGISSGLIMTLGADHAPRAGRARFLGLWRLMADVGAACGPALLSFLAAALSLAAGIAATGLIGLAAAWQLAHWIPRFGDRGGGRT
jgi:MFS family permease